MASKLDQALDEIVTSNRASRGRGRGRGGRRVASKTTTSGPVGGIKKNTRGAAKGPVKAATPTGPANATGESKIIVSNLPSDVSEQQIKEYFGKSVGPVKRAHLTYGPNGVSRGIATVVFSKPNSANDALISLNGVKVDNRPMKVEVVLDAARAPPPAPVKGLSERIGQAKGAAKDAKPKSAAAKAVTNGSPARAGRAGRRAARAGRPKRKTADELDAEMVDYFDATATTNGAVNGVTDGAAQPAAAEEVMDEIS